MQQRENNRGILVECFHGAEGATAFEPLKHQIYAKIHPQAYQNVGEIHTITYLHSLSEVVFGGRPQGGGRFHTSAAEGGRNKPNFGTEGAEIKKNRVLSQTRPILTTKSKIRPILAVWGFIKQNFSKIWKNFEKKFALMKPHRPIKRPKNAIEMKISGVDNTPQKSSPHPPIPLLPIVPNFRVVQ